MTTDLPRLSRLVPCLAWMAAACGSPAKSRTIPTQPIPAPPAIETEVVQWNSGRETVLVRTPTMDATAWPRPAGIWYVRPAQRDLDGPHLATFFETAVALGIAGISLADCAAATDHTIANGLASRPSSLTFVDLSGTAVTDASAPGLAALPRIEHVWMSSTSITDASLQDLAKGHSLKSVRADETAITDIGLAALATLPALEVVSANGTLLSSAGVDALLVARPLQYLGIARTAIAGDALTSLARRCSLTGIDLRRTAIDDATVATSLASCAALHSLDLAETRITDVGLLALHALPLTRLDVSHTQVHSRALEVFHELTEMTWLDLGYTNVTNRGVAWLTKLTKLEHLGLAYVGAGADAIVVVKNNPALREIDLTAAKLGDDDLAELATRVDLEVLVLRHTAITDAALARLTTTKLRVLDVGGTQVTGASMPRHAGWSSLEELYLSDMQPGGAFGSLGSLYRLRVLHVAGLAFDDAAAQALRPLHHLEELDLSRTRVTSAALPVLATLPGLRALALDQVPIGDSDASVLATFHALETLTVARTSLSDTGAIALAALPHLAKLSIEQTQVTDAGCQRLAASLRLSAINVGGTQVTATCLLALSRIPTLTELDADEVPLGGIDLQFAPGSRIATLSLDGTLIDDHAVPGLLALRSLRELHVNGAKLTTKARSRLTASGIALH